MIRILTITLFITFLFLPLSAFTEIKTVTHTLKQPFGGSQSPDDARTAGIAKAKREALEQFGTYIESTTIVKNTVVDSDEILALTAGVTKTEVVKQRNYMDGDAFGMEITVTVELDTAVLEKSLKRLLEDRNHLKDLKDVREREKKLLARIAELEKENSLKGKTEEKSAELKREFKEASQGMTAVEWFEKAVNFWDGKKFSDPNKAIEYFTQVIHLAPNFAPAYQRRGFVYAELKQFSAAIADYDQAIHFNPNAEWTYFLRGFAYRELKQLDRAISDFDQAIRLNPNDAAAYSLRGAAYQALGQLDREMADYNQAIRLDPNSAGTYTLRALAYEMLKQFERVVSDLDQVIRLDPKNVQAYLSRGFAYGNLKQLDRALADFDQAIRLDSNSARAYGGRGIVHAQLKQFDRAITNFDQAIYLDPKNATAFELRGLIYLKLNEKQKSCADLNTACELGKCGGYEFAKEKNFCR
jgi:tetratricopeptide (TPR) repeat protein